jgi:hypothetical protein
VTAVLTRRALRAAAVADSLFLEGYAFPTRATRDLLAAARLCALQPGQMAFSSQDRASEVPALLHTSFFQAVLRLAQVAHVPALPAAIRLLPGDHPAAAGLDPEAASNATGVFVTSAESIPAHTVLCLYGGEIINEEQCDSRHQLPDGSKNVYVFGVDTNVGIEMSIDASALPRCFGSCFNDYRGILEQPNCAAVEILCNCKCRCRCGNSFPEVTHPHVVIFTTETVQPGSELCLDYGTDYWKMLGVNPNPPRSQSSEKLVSKVLDSSFSTRRTIFEALSKQFEVEAAADSGAYLDQLLDAEEPSDEFCDSIDLIRTFSGKHLKFSTAVAVSNSSAPSRGFAFSLNKDISPRTLFLKGMNSDSQMAARFLEMLRRSAMVQKRARRVLDGGGRANEPCGMRAVKRAAGASAPGAPHAALTAAPVHVVDDEAAGGATLSLLVDAATRADVGGGSQEPGFSCYGAWVPLSRLKAAFDARIRIESEFGKGFWGRIATDVGIPNLDRCPTATGRAGNVHKRYCEHFNHPFVSAVGAKDV